jgi:AcrR family transcriptional regulator
MDHKPYHHGDLKRALVEAGLGILAEQGLPALSLRAIAARAGVSHAAPKNHFGSLRGLITAIAAEGFRRHAAEMQAGLDAGASREDRLLAACEGYVRFAMRHPALFELMFAPSHPDHSDPDLGSAGTASYAILSDIARDLDWDHADAPDAQVRAEMMLWSLVHGYAHLAIAGLFGPNGATGAPVVPVAGILPRFRYRRAGADGPAAGPIDSG